jgi:hypothetical protein
MGTGRRVAIPITDLARALQRDAAAQESYSSAAVGLVADLDEAGFAVARLRDLRRSSVGSRGALPILLWWFPIVDLPLLKGDIAYVLGSRWAQPEGALALIAEYRRIGDDARRETARVRAAICTSLERVADDELFPEIRQIALDPKHGAQRGLAIVALGNMRTRRDEAADHLMCLLDDSDVVLYALLGLVKLDARDKALRRVAFLTHHRHPIVRQVARRALRRWRAAEPTLPAGEPY